MNIPLLSDLTAPALLALALMGSAFLTSGATASAARSSFPSDSSPSSSGTSASALRSEGALCPAGTGLWRGPTHGGERVEIATKDHLKIVASWYAPRKKGRPVPGVLLIHDANSDRRSMRVLAERIHKDGLAVLSIDLRGHGQSKTKNLDWAKMDPSEQAAQWAFAQRDVDAAVDWLLAQKNVHSTRLALVAHAAGCALAVRHARDDENTVAVALIEPPQKCYGFDVKADILDLEGLPTYIVAPRGSSEHATEAMVQAANSVSGGNPFIELWLKRPPVLEDRKTASRVSSFLLQHAMPKKGR